MAKTVKVPAARKSVAPKKATEKVESPKSSSVKTDGLKADVMGVNGEVVGSVTLPKEIFAGKVNTQLMAQAVRVYLSNQREGTASTKTRGEVEGSTKKIFRQKGTGKARHGSIRAPIFVGGGIAFGPRPRDYSLQLSSKMKRQALVSALTTQYKDGHIAIIDGLEGLEPKTKRMATALQKAGMTGQTLLVVVSKENKVMRATRNIGFLDLMPVDLLHTYAVLSHKKIIFMKQAVEAMHEKEEKTHE